MKTVEDVWIQQLQTWLPEEVYPGRNKKHPNNICREQWLMCLPQLSGTTSTGVLRVFYLCG